MGSFNRVILMGNVTRDPELRYIPSGTAVSDLGLAVNDRRKNASGEWVDETTFVDVTLWGRTAEIACEYLNKGSPVFIEGRLKLDTWEKDGKKNYKLRVVGERLQLIGAKGRRWTAAAMPWRKRLPVGPFARRIRSQFRWWRYEDAAGRRGRPLSRRTAEGRHSVLKPSERGKPRLHDARFRIRFFRTYP